MDAKTAAAIQTAGLSDDDTAKVIAALDAITTDPAVGTVIRNPATGDVALHVGQYGNHYWRVYSTDDRTWIETDLVGWDSLHKPEPAATPTSSWTNADIKAYADANQIDLGGATTKADMLAAINTAEGTAP